jgi:hypothetical protein
MFSAMLLSISIVAFAQFALFYWRAVLAGVAGQPVSSQVLEAAHVSDGELSGKHFEVLAELHDLTPDTQSSPGGLGLVRLYYKAMQLIRNVAGSRLASLAKWADQESMLCAKYAAVRIDRRLQANMALAATVRSC